MDYSVVKTENPVKPFIIQNKNTGECVNGHRYFSKEEAEAEATELMKSHEVSPVGTFGGFHRAADEYGSPSFKRFFEDKPRTPVTAEELAVRHESPKPKPREDQTPPAVTTEEVRALQAQLTALRAEVLKAPEDRLGEMADEVQELSEDGEEQQAQLDQVGERVDRLQQLTSNVKRLSEVL